MKPHWLLTFFGFSLFSHAAIARDITIASFNIAWYGLGGVMAGSPESEHRDETLKSFIDNNLGHADIIVFQEIVDPDRLMSVLMNGTRRCQGYDHTFEKHQRVILCAKNEFQLTNAPADDDFIIEGVAFDETKSRPALTVYVVDSAGTPLLHVVGVHLKAYPYESERRLIQTTAIASYLSSLEREVPIVAIGDFNTYDAPANRQEANDKDLIKKTFVNGGIDMRIVRNDNLMTYRKGRNVNQLDQIYHTSDVTVVGQPTVIGPCNNATTEEANVYNREISDHCPLVVKLRLPAAAAGE